MLDLDQALTVATSAARAAGERILRGYDEAIDVTVKSDPVDRVTQVDTDAQQLIVDTIKQSFPEHGFLGEEDLTEEGQQARWVIDPMDGTSNFIQGLPHVGTSIGLEVQGEAVLGVLYFPVYDDLYTAVKGQGAYRNGQQIQVRNCSQLSEAVVAEIFSDRTHRGQPVTFPPSLAYRKFGSAITSLAYVADGRVQATALKCCRWDIAAAEVIITEAGGRITWQYDEPGDERGVLTCFASCPGIHEEFMELARREYKN